MRFGEIRQIEWISIELDASRDSWYFDIVSVDVSARVGFDLLAATGPSDVDSNTLFDLWIGETERHVDLVGAIGISPPISHVLTRKRENVRLPEIPGDLFGCPARLDRLSLAAIDRSWLCSECMWRKKDACGERREVSRSAAADHENPLYMRKAGCLPGSETAGFPRISGLQLTDQNNACSFLEMSPSCPSHIAPDCRGSNITGCPVAASTSSNRHERTPVSIGIGPSL
ncbi:hypothetical protein NB722_001516 [Xanthomonas sacchari]|nr:hypothetical protein [Xanthomonas sacchari]